jgi:phosphate transport system protein
MNIIENELQRLKSGLIEMWESVLIQIQKARVVVETGDTDLVHEMAAGEKRIDSYELKNDLECENILALYYPLANDLRFVLAVLKINYNLERIADFAWGIGKAIRDDGKKMSGDAIEKNHLILMLDTTIQMLKDDLVAFEAENNVLARSVFEMDKILDLHNKNAINITADLIRSNPDETRNYLTLLTIIRKVERMGDHTKNISEEIIFYIEAKIVKHHRKNKGKTSKKKPQSEM